MQTPLSLLLHFFFIFFFTTGTAATVRHQTARRPFLFPSCYELNSLQKASARDFFFLNWCYSLLGVVEGDFNVISTRRRKKSTSSQMYGFAKRTSPSLPWMSVINFRRCAFLATKEKIRDSSWFQEDISQGICGPLPKYIRLHTKLQRASEKHVKESFLASAFIFFPPFRRLPTLFPWHCRTGYWVILLARAHRESWWESLLRPDLRVKMAGAIASGKGHSTSEMKNNKW